MKIYLGLICEYLFFTSFSVNKSLHFITYYTLYLSCEIRWPEVFRQSHPFSLPSFFATLVFFINPNPSDNLQISPKLFATKTSRYLCKFTFECHSKTEDTLQSSCSLHHHPNRIVIILFLSFAYFAIRINQITFSTVSSLPSCTFACRFPH